MRRFALQYGCDFVSVMPTNLYGNNDNFNLQTSHVLPALLRKIHLAKLLSLGKLEQVEKDVGLQGAELKAFLQTYGITERSVAIWGSGIEKSKWKSLVKRLKFSKKKSVYLNTPSKQRLKIIPRVRNVLGEKVQKENKPKKVKL